MRTVNDIELPPRGPDTDTRYRMLLAACLKSTVFRSQLDSWCRQHPSKDSIDYLDAIQKPYRDAGAMPSFPNLASYAAWVLGLSPSAADGWAIEP